MGVLVLILVCILMVPFECGTTTLSPKPLLTAGNAKAKGTCMTDQRPFVTVNNQYRNRVSADPLASKHDIAFRIDGYL